MENDTMRYYPEGINPNKELMLNVWVTAWAYNLFSDLTPGLNLIDYTIYYSVFSSALIFLLMFFLVMELFNDKRIALLATAFLAFAPTFLFRTIGGFYEKEPLATAVIIGSFLFFIKGIKEENRMFTLLFGAVSGFFAGLAALSWGGYVFLFLTISAYMIIETILFRINDKKVITFILWTAVMLPMAMFLTDRYEGFGIYNWWAFQIVLAVLGLLLFYQFIYKKYLSKYYNDFNNKIGSPIISFFKYLSERKDFKKLIKQNKTQIPESVYFLITAVLFILVAGILIMGPEFVFSRFAWFNEMIQNPFGTNPFALSVSELQPPYFYDPYRGIDWWSHFGFLLFPIMIGIVLLTLETFKPLKLKIPFTVIIIALIYFITFSRLTSLTEYSTITNFLSSDLTISAVFFTALLLILILYFKTDKNKIQKISSEHLLLLLFYFVVLIAARGSVRTFFMLAVPGMIIVAYCFIRIADVIKKISKDYIYTGFILLVCFILLGFNISETFYKAQGFYPSLVGGWDETLDWIKTNTTANAVFAHWWDYGYWVQTAGNRTTVLDGGNYRVDWNELMGRYIFAGQNSTEILNTLEVWNRPDYFLIVDDDVLKYYQMGRIGGWETFFSVFGFIPEEGIGEVAENTLIEPETYPNLLIFQGDPYAPLDQDLIIDDKVYSKDSTVVYQIMIPTGEDIGNPYAVIYNAKYGATLLPFRCRCDQFKGCYYISDKGLDACVSIIGRGAVFIPKKAMNMLFTNLYIAQVNNMQGFHLAYDNSIPLSYKGIKYQSINDIKIYEIDYDELEVYSGIELMINNITRIRSETNNYTIYENVISLLMNAGREVVLGNTSQAKGLLSEARSLLK